MILISCILISFWTYVIRSVKNESLEAIVWYWQLLPSDEMGVQSSFKYLIFLFPVSFVFGSMSLFSSWKVFSFFFFFENFPILILYFPPFSRSLPPYSVSPEFSLLFLLSEVKTMISSSWVKILKMKFPTLHCEMKNGNRRWNIFHFLTSADRILVWALFITIPIPEASVLAKPKLVVKAFLNTFAHINSSCVACALF